jgi:adenylate cyclase, class 2
MKHRNEIEIKLSVLNPTGLKRRLAALRFRVSTPRYFEQNSMFDFPNERLRKAGCLLRLRFTGKRYLLTYKGSAAHSRQYKIRPEVETYVEDGPAMRGILESLGMRETFRYEKFRTVYVQGKRERENVHHELVFDETPIGHYIEIEGTQRWIDTIARQLGYKPGDYIVASYAALFRQRCRQVAKDPGNMVFDFLKPGVQP